LAGSFLPMPVPPRPALRNHTEPSAPAVRPPIDWPATRPFVNSVTTPSGVTRPTTGGAVAPALSANQTLPSGPAAIEVAGDVSGPNSVAVFVVASNLPMRLATYSVNQRLPSGPLVIA